MKRGFERKDTEERRKNFEREPHMARPSIPERYSAKYE